MATIGRIEVHPNGAAIISGAVKMILDLRASNDHSYKLFMHELNATHSQISQQENCDIKIELIAAAPIAEMDKDLRIQLAGSAEKLGLRYINLPSGAGHDMAHMSRIAPAAMIFIPCQNGMSHCPEEFTTPEAIAKGSAVITRALIDMARPRG